MVNVRSFWIIKEPLHWLPAVQLAFAAFKPRLEALTLAFNLTLCALRVKMSANHDSFLFGFETVQDMIHKFVFLGDDRNLVQVYVKGRCVKNLVC